MESDDKAVSSNAIAYDRDSDYDEIFSFDDEKQNYKWAVSWSDLMMTMFILFAVMYMYRVGDNDLTFGPGPGKNNLSDQGSNSVISMNLKGEPRAFSDQTKQAIKEVMLGQSDSINLSKDSTVRIVLAGDLFFDSGSASLKVGSRYQIDQVADVLNENDYVVNIVGHTDDSPARSASYPTNWELSSKRAVMVARYLIEEQKVDENRVFISAHSSSQPVASNDTSYNRALNRRVEIILMKQKPYAQ
jgi:chemotaxis protein MotB